MTYSQSDELIYPKHIAIVMDGNGRWAKQRGLPRAKGHEAGAKTVRTIVEYCAAVDGIEMLTLFAFSTENWNRPKLEVELLMQLFKISLKTEVPKLHKNNIKLIVSGNKSRFSKSLTNRINKSIALTSKNTGLVLNIAADYGGKWDIVNAVNQAKTSNKDITIDDITNNLTTSNLPNPDLFIRTGGEKRISNFLIWQLAYTELYFTDVYWPDFTNEEMQKACNDFGSKERRFGKITEQL